MDIRRVHETAPKAVAEAAHFKTDTAHPEIEGPEALADYDAIIVGAPTRFGRMPSQMAQFWDMTGGLWAKGALVGKIGGAFTSTASQHGGQETTLFSIITNLMHQGMTIVGLDYGFQAQMGVDKVLGGSPYGATTIAGRRWQPSTGCGGAGWRALSGQADRRTRGEGCGVSQTPPRWREGGAHRATEGGCRERCVCGSPPPPASLVPLPVPGRSYFRHFFFAHTGNGGAFTTVGQTGALRMIVTPSTAGRAGKRARALANRNRARAAPGSDADVPTQRQCHGSHFTFWPLPPGNDISNPYRVALAISQRAIGVAAMHASASGQPLAGRTAKSIA